MLWIQRASGYQRDAVGTGVAQRDALGAGGTQGDAKGVGGIPGTPKDVVGTGGTQTDAVGEDGTQRDAVGAGGTSGTEGDDVGAGGIPGTQWDAVGENGAQRDAVAAAGTQRDALGTGGIPGTQWNAVGEDGTHRDAVGAGGMPETQRHADHPSGSVHVTHRACSQSPGLQGFSRNLTSAGFPGPIVCSEPCVQSSHKAAPKVTAQTMPAAGASSILQPYKKQQQNPTKLLSRTGSISHYICLPFGSTAGSQQRLTAPSLPANMPPFK